MVVALTTGCTEVRFDKYVLNLALNKTFQMNLTTINNVTEEDKNVKNVVQLPRRHHIITCIQSLITPYIMRILKNIYNCIGIALNPQHYSRSITPSYNSGCVGFVGVIS